MAVLNTIMAEALDDVATRLEPHAGTPEFKSVVRELIRELVTKHDRIIFNGNGYSDEWVKEAEQRGLPHIKTTPEALEVLSRPDTIALMEKYGVLSRSELLARKEIQLESFEKLIDIEAKTCLNMLRTIYLPAIATQMTEICGTVGAIQAAGLTAGLKAATHKAEEIGTLYDTLAPQVEALAVAIDAGEPFAMRAAMEQARQTVDALEAVVDAALWPVPTYAQMLNIHSR
ncbi:MAG: glutamine synthetase type III, partial [Akkermansia sp.]|nr:glutamine synthetase type III [Akkermansia sp.]